MTLAEQVTQTAITTTVSGFLNLFILYYLRRYFDKKIEVEEEQRKERENQRKQRAIIEADRRHAAGRYFFWLHHAATKGKPNGELEDAKRNYEDAEARQKALEQAMIADIDIKDT